tara:strand:- start:74 stop:289 length:216 start_codon:yes stop_codon:yes gene_type:complete
MENISIDNGVFPVPPKYIFPTQITGIEQLLDFVNRYLSLLKKLISRVIGNNKMEKNDTCFLSQKLGLKKFI